MVTGVNIRGDTKINFSFVALEGRESFAAAEMGNVGFAYATFLDCV